MFEGRLEAIVMGQEKRAMLRTVAEIQAIAGSGLQGDRYCQNQGTFSKPGTPDREVTLIEMEALEALNRETNIALKPVATWSRAMSR